MRRVLFQLRGAVLQPLRRHEPLRYAGVADFDWGARPRRLFEDGGVDWTISEGENWAVLGPNGSGKSVVLGTITGTTLVPQGDIFRAAGVRITVVSAEQQKRRLLEMEAKRQEEEWASGVPVRRSQVGQTVEEILRRAAPGEERRADAMRRQLGLDTVRGTGIGSLSTGEFRKLCLAEAILSRPDVLVLDEPFDGLDAASRGTVTDILEETVAWKGLAGSGGGGTMTTLVLVTHRHCEIIRPISRILEVDPRGQWVAAKDRHVTTAKLNATPRGTRAANEMDQTTRRRPNALLPPPSITASTSSSSSSSQDRPVIARLDGVDVVFGDRCVLEDFHLIIRGGERLLLRGANGSGKSSLCKLLAQAARRSEAAVGRGGGTGGGGGIPPGAHPARAAVALCDDEGMAAHAKLPRGCLARDVICAGHFGAVGLNALCPPVTPWHLARVRARALDVGLDDTTLATAFEELSQGQQQRVLVARALVCDPALLVLDEPLRGVDEAGRCDFLHVLDQAMAANPRMALVFVTHYQDETPRCITDVVDLT